MAGSTHPDTRAMALAVSASGIVAGARFPRDALCVRRRAPEAAKVRFPRAKSSDTSRRRRTDARFPTTSGASIAPLRRRGDGDARRASFDKQRPADLEPPEPLGIFSDILTPCLAFRARAGASHPPHLALSPPIRLGVNDLPENENDAAPRVRALVQRARHARAERTRVLAAERLGARPPPPDRAALAALEARAEEAREASERAQRHLYDASARLKQTEAPVAEARQRHNEASRKVDELLVKLQVAEDALRRAEGTYDPASSSNDAAARAKHGAGAAMARLTGEAKAAGEEASRARHVLAEKRDALLDAASRRKTPSPPPRRRGRDGRRRPRAHRRGRALPGYARARGPARRSARRGEAARRRARGGGGGGSKLDAAAAARARRSRALDAASNAQLRALFVAEQSVDDAARLTDAHARASLECENAEARFESAVALRDATRAEFRAAVDAASAVRAAAASSQADFAKSLERCTPRARAGVSARRGAPWSARFTPRAIARRT